MSRSRTPVALAVLTLTLTLALVAVPASLAKGRDAVRSTGTCTGPSTSKLKLGRDDRGIEVELEVDQNRNGVPWQVVIRRNGATVASLTATTRGPSGSFEVRRVITGRLGSAQITAVATRAGETCTVSSAARTTTSAATPTSTTTPRSGGADDGSRHDAGDDHGRHGRGHA